MSISPCKLQGEVKAPSSKSVAHRAIICASLANGKSVVSNVSFSDDIIATIECMKALGAKIERSGDKLVIEGSSKRINKDLTFDCNESGSTLRFMIPIALALNSGKNEFIGRGKLGTRPLDVYEKICREQGIAYENNSDGGLLKLRVKGQLKSGKFNVDGGVSSQFITGLAFALPLLEGYSEISIEGELQSVGYLDLTVATLKDFAIKIKYKDQKGYVIQGRQEYKACDYEVEGDWSQAAFFEVANYLGDEIEIKGLRADSKQGDKVIVDFIKRLKDAKEEDTLVFDCGNCPDIVPELALACALRKGKSEIVNVSRLRIKECDRLSATGDELKTLGADIKEENDNIYIVGVDKLNGGAVSTHGDHRMAMTLAIAATRTTGNVELDNYTCVSKSYPNFFDVFRALKGKTALKDN
ncbi:MAG: 3-phosphoshikimate 1-carboxyvinyltransferase [Clostridia bacterium]|nr:3-phosphoshikimate 1-carboxyvinyltransferase [Clostridia bacterium]